MPFFFKDLPVQIPQKNLKGIFKTIIPKLNRALRKIEFSIEENELCTIKVGNAVIDISNPPFKTLYDSLINLKQIELPYIPKWQNIFTENNLEWDKIWGAIHESICDFKVQIRI